MEGPVSLCAPEVSNLQQLPHQTIPFLPLMCENRSHTGSAHTDLNLQFHTSGIKTAAQEISLTPPAGLKSPDGWLPFWANTFQKKWGWESSFSVKMSPKMSPSGEFHLWAHVN